MRDFREEVREFARRELPEGWLGHFDEYDPHIFPFTREITRKLGRLGWLSLPWPREYGGEDSIEKQLVFQEEASYFGIPGTGMGVGGTAWVAPSLILFGTEEQKRKYLPGIASGEDFWCTAYSEPETGSDLASLRTRAVKRDGCYIINGQKIWTSAAHISKYCWLAVRTGPEAHKGITLLIVPLEEKGITVRPIINMGGLHHYNEVFFDDVKVKEENRVGEENRGWFYIMKALDMERAWPGVRYSSYAMRAFDELLNLAGDRLGDRRLKLAELRIEIEVGRLLARRAINILIKGGIPNYEASISKVYNSELLQRISVFGLELLGLLGILDGEKSPLYGFFKKLYLLSPLNNIAGGTSEIQRLIIAQRGLGLPR